MKKVIGTMTAALAWAMMAGPAWAGVDEKDVAEVVKRVMDNKPVGGEPGEIPG